MSSFRPTWDQAWLADGALGKLARTLRMLGVDCAFARGAPAAELCARARGEARLLLTRRADLARCDLPAGAVWIAANHLPAQLQALLRLCGPLPRGRRYTRCLVCNAVLQTCVVEEVRAQLPLYVQERFTEFRRCPSCARVYWPGTHRERMERNLDRLLAEIGDQP